ncbi:SPFH domain / Band 7 family protein [Vibrio aerogenes CECT 7868]|uniref:SPFH domain / Band 7 family protein n=1 Tax=Vibrio aerogenes CECT 7868 TaxID=1216006 RepID=A0A1M5ZPG0_9VIBR|nr:prohibitin family protein [Vibrio aerogenes]SHI26038.1 SPFH domain / Band 7 family protein [Vibrio aerogenes CECT 7868]
MNINLPVWLLPSILFGLITFGGMYFFLSKHYPERFWIIRFIRKNRIQLSLTALFFIFILLTVGPKVLIPVPYGHAGVLWKRFGGGTDLSETLREGTALVMPWNRIYIYSTKYQTITHEFEAVTKNGLATKVYVILRFRVIRSTLPYLHVNAGVHYIERMLLPEIGSWSRLVIARHSAEEVYSSNRLEVQKEIFSLLKGEVETLESDEGLSCELTEDDGDGHFGNAHCSAKDYFEIQDFLIQSIDLPKGIREAIVRKIEQTHLADEYDWRITVAEKEAVRKEKEAEGIAKFQSIVTGGISDTYLRWRGIEATLELAKSDNSKVVVIGGGQDGLPIILNTAGEAKSSVTEKTTTEQARSDTFLSVKPDELKKEEHVTVNGSSRCVNGCDEVNPKNKTKQKEQTLASDPPESKTVAEKSNP